MAENRISDDQLRSAASESVAGGDHIRERIRDLTLQALQQRRFDYAGFKEVMQSMTEGISLGAAQRGHDVKQALSEAFAGMDQAMTKAAQASSLALKEMTDKTRDFSATDFKQAMDQMQRMESDFLDTVSQVSKLAGGVVKSEWQDLVMHARRAGTDTGAVISQTMRDFSKQMAAAMAEGTVAGMEAARQFGERFAQAASGILAGMSEALRSDKDQNKKT